MFVGLPSRSSPRLHRQGQIVHLRQGYGATAPKAFGAGGKGIRTPDFQLAKLALYQLSYAPCKLSILDCGSRIANEQGMHASLAKADAGWRFVRSPSGNRALLRTGRSCVRAL